MSVAGRMIVAGVVGMLGLAAAGGRTLSFSGTLLNKEDWSGRFPEGAGFTLSVDLDDSQPDPTPGNPEIAQYDGDLSNASLSIPSLSFSRGGEVFNGGRWVVDRRAGPSEPSVRGSFTILGETLGDENEINVEIDFYHPFGSPPASTSLLQPFDTTAFRLIEVRFEVPDADNQGRHLAGFGWLRPDGVEPAEQAPPPIAGSGYRGILGLGDSLSASKNPDLDPGEGGMVFDEGYTNGPVWIQYLSWLLGRNYREDLNFSQFGGFELPRDEELLDEPFADLLATEWSNSELLLAIFSIVLNDGSPGAEASSGAAAILTQSAYLRAAELAHALGCRNLLVLGAVDIGFAPDIAVFLATQDQRDLLTDFVAQANQVRNDYIDEWFGSLFPGLGVSYLDPNPWIAEIEAAPADFGFTNMNETVLDSGLADKSFDGPGSTYFFWDGIAPTTKVHCQLAGRVHDALLEQGRPAAFRGRIVRLTDDQVWLFAADPPQGGAVSLVADADPGQLAVAAALKSVGEVKDPCLFFAVDRPAAAAQVYQFRSEP